MQEEMASEEVISVSFEHNYCTIIKTELNEKNDIEIKNEFEYCYSNDIDSEIFKSEEISENGMTKTEAEENDEGEENYTDINYSVLLDYYKGCDDIALKADFGSTDNLKTEPTMVNVPTQPPVNEVVSSEGYKALSQPTNNLQTKPPFTYSKLIELALSEHGELPVSGIYHWISNHFPFYKANDGGWKNAVRHFLSINPHFRKGGKAAHGAGHLWSIAQGDKSKSWQMNDMRISSVTNTHQSSQTEDDIHVDFINIPDGVTRLEATGFDKCLPSRSTISAKVEKERDVDSDIDNESLDYRLERSTILNPNKKYECYECSYQCEHKGSLKSHIFTNHQWKKAPRYACKLCPYETGAKGSLNRHILLIHRRENAPRYTCKLCRYESVYKKDQNKHIMTVHPPRARKGRTVVVYPRKRKGASICM